MNRIKSIVNTDNIVDHVEDVVRTVFWLKLKSSGMYKLYVYCIKTVFKRS